MSRPPQLDCTAVEDRVQVSLAGHIARQHELAAHRRRKLADARLEALALKREGQLGALARQSLGNRPGDAASVGDAKNQAAPAFEHRHTRYYATVARVVSVNVNTRKEFRKLPIPEARLVADFGLEGDRHAGRPERQVSILNAETVTELAEQGMPVSPGVLGENITVEGMPVMQLEPGARLLIGQDAELEITGDRPACREMLDVHVDCLKAMVGRSGKMARVVRGGVIRPGDRVRLIEEQVLARRAS